MKFQLLFCIVLALVATFIATEAEAAPSKNSGKRHGSKGSEIKLLTENLRSFLQNWKGHEGKTVTKANAKTSASVSVSARSIENPGLLKLVNYLTWLSDLVIQDYIPEIFDLLEKPLDAFNTFQVVLFEALENAGVDFSGDYDEYFLVMEDEYWMFYNGSRVFWDNWVLHPEPEHIREQLLIHIPQIQRYFSTFATITFNYLMSWVNLSQILLTPEALQELLAEIQVALDEAAVSIDKLKAALAPPSDIVGPPTNLTLETFLGFLPYIANLNASSIILDGLSTIKQVQDLRHGFNDDLVAILGEADADLESGGSNLTETFELAFEDRRKLNRIAFDKVVYIYFNNDGNVWAWYVAIGQFYDSFLTGWEQIPPLSVDTILQLVELVETTSSEYQQRASDLVTTSLQKADTLIKNYLQVFKPQDNKP